MYRAITDYSISKRSNDPCTEYSVNFNTPQTLASIWGGRDITFYIDDPNAAAQYKMYKGIIQDFKRTIKPAALVYGVTGRDVAWYLTKQKFNVDCDLPGDNVYVDDAPNQSFTPQQLLDLILENTRVTSMRGSPSLANVNMSNAPLLNEDERPAWFCGTFDSKVDALDFFFAQYAKMMGKDEYKWYVDFNGTLQWYEVGKARYPSQSLMFFYEDDARILDGEMGDNCENVINKVKCVGGTPEGGSNPITMELYDSNSRIKYGLIEGDDISFNDITDDTLLRERCGLEFAKKTKAIYTASLTLLNTPSLVPGMQVVFPDDPYVPNEIFTVVDMKLDGKPGIINLNQVTMTTDETAFTKPNIVEVVDQMIEQKLQQKVQVTTIVEKDDSLSNPTAIVQPESGGSTEPSMSPGKSSGYSNIKRGGNFDILRII